MNKEQMDLALKILTFLEGTADKYFNQKSEHDKTIEHMHTNKMNTKKECLEKIILFAAPLVTAGAFYLKSKITDTKISDEQESDIKETL